MCSSCVVYVGHFVHFTSRLLRLNTRACIPGMYRVRANVFTSEIEPSNRTTTNRRKNVCGGEGYVVRLLLACSRERLRRRVFVVFF